MNLAGLSIQRSRVTFVLLTVVPNTLVGLVILMTGVFGPFADRFGPGWLFLVFAIFSAVATSVRSATRGGTW